MKLVVLKTRIAPAILVLMAALATGGLARFWNLTAHSLYVDEGFTFFVAGKSWQDMMGQIVYHDFHPPLFYVLTHFAIGLLHWPAWDFRYLTASTGLVTIVAAWAIARRLFGDVAASFAALLVALDPSLIEWDRLYRMYSVMTALAALSWWLLLIAQEKRGRAAFVWWGVYGIVSVAQPYIQYLGALNVLCQGLYALTDLRRTWPAIAWGAVAALALVPWLPSLRIQAANLGGAGTASDWWPIARDTIMTGTPAAWTHLPWYDFAFSCATVAIAILGVLRGRKTILPYWLAVAAIQLIVSFVGLHFIAVPRFLEQTVPAFLIAASAAFDILVSRVSRPIALAAGAAVPVLFLLGSYNLLFDPYYQNTDWYLINSYVLGRERPDDAMLFVQGFPVVVVGDFTAFRHREVLGPVIPSQVPATIRWLDQHPKQRVWYIENEFFFVDPQKIIKAHLDGTRKPLLVVSENKARADDVVNVILYSTILHGRVHP